jgi:hypothetical protein
MRYLGKNYLDVVDVVAVPGSAEEFVTKSKNQNVLNHLLAQVVVNSEDFVLGPVGRKRFLEVSRALKILAKRLLDLLCTWLVA